MSFLSSNFNPNNFFNNFDPNDLFYNFNLVVSFGASMIQVDIGGHPPSPLGSPPFFLSTF